MAYDKLVDSTQLNADLTSVANAIRAKSGGSGQLSFPSGFVSEIGNIPSGGGSIDFDDFLSRAEPSGAQTADSITTVGPYACYARKGITSITSDSITTIREYAFQYCPKLETLNLSNLEYMRTGASGTNESSNGLFFSNCKLKNVYLPKLKRIYGNSAFAENNIAGAVYVLPALENVKLRRAFYNVGNATIDIGPGLQGLDSDCFYNGFVGGNAPNDTVILRRTADVVTAGTTDSIRCIKYLYVPQSLVSAYQTATNWVTRYNAGYLTIYAIEGSQYEHYYANGVTIPT